MMKYLNYCSRKTRLKKIKLCILKTKNRNVCQAGYVFPPSFYKKIKVLICFQFLKKEKEKARRRKEGRKLSKALKENSTVGTVKHTNSCASYILETSAFVQDLKSGAVVNKIFLQ